MIGTEENNFPHNLLSNDRQVVSICKDFENNSSKGTGKTALIVSNEERRGMMEIVKSLEDSGLVKKGIIQTIENKKKEKRDGFLVSC